VAAGVDFYSNFSMNGFKLECKKKKILKYYEKLIDNLSLAERLNEISHEYFLLGDVFPFLEIKCPHCQANLRVPVNKQTDNISCPKCKKTIGE
jgi:transposase-like protein